MNSSVDEAKTAIAHLATLCEQALKCAAFADDNREFYARGMGDSLRRCAVLHSDQAWRWVDSLRRAKGAAV